MKGYLLKYAFTSGIKVYDFFPAEDPRDRQGRADYWYFPMGVKGPVSSARAAEVAFSLEDAIDQLNRVRIAKIEEHRRQIVKLEALDVRETKFPVLEEP